MSVCSSAAASSWRASASSLTAKYHGIEELLRASITRRSAWTRTPPMLNDRCPVGASPAGLTRAGIQRLEIIFGIAPRFAPPFSLAGRGQRSSSDL